MSEREKPRDKAWLQGVLKDARKAKKQLPKWAGGDRDELFPEPHPNDSFCRFKYPNYGTPDGHPEHTKHSGQVVQIVRLMGYNEADQEGGPHYEIRAADGWTGTALHDELTPAKPRAAIRSQLISAGFWDELGKLKEKFPMVYIQVWTPNDFDVSENVVSDEANWADPNHIDTAQRLDRNFDATQGTTWESVAQAIS